MKFNNGIRCFGLQGNTSVIFELINKLKKQNKNKIKQPDHISLDGEKYLAFGLIYQGKDSFVR